MKRRVEPEWLDELPAEDPRAVASRRDLTRVNRIMGNAGILGRMILEASSGRSPRRVVELGAGDGRFLLDVARRLAPRWPGVSVGLLDRREAVHPETRAAFAALGWTVEVITADVFDWLEQSEAQTDILVANLFLHHFQPGPLTKLLALAARRTKLLAACEPRRSAVALAASRLLGCIGYNDVTRHDAVVSVRAGFAGTELSGWWPVGSEWRLREEGARLFSHAFVATRVGGI